MKTLLCVIAVISIYVVCIAWIPLLWTVSKHEEVLGIAKYAKSMLIDR